MAELKNKGTFASMLVRTNSKLRTDRGLIIVGATEKSYRRTIEDLQDEMDNLTIDQSSMMDINPGNTQTIINPTDFDHAGYVKRDLEMGIRIRNTQIKLEVAKERYEALFTAQKEEE